MIFPARSVPVPLSAHFAAISYLNLRAFVSAGQPRTHRLDSLNEMVVHPKRGMVKFPLIY